MLSNVFTARVLHRSLLSLGPTTKPIYCIQFSCPKGYTFEPGDVVFVHAKNDPKWVQRALSILKATGKEQVTGPNGAQWTLEEALLEHYELRFKANVWEQVPSELKDDFWGCLAWYQQQSIVTNLGRYLLPMRPRAYSIASAQKLAPDRFDLVLALVTYRTVEGGICEGLSSGFLCKRIQVGDEVPLHIIASKFRLPKDDSRPVIMVGPGTGIAPFKAFLEYRKAVGAPGPNWLFFGGRHQANDFILKDFLESMQADGFLTRLDLAFSRDQDHKVYVQHRMLEHAKELWDWFRRGAYFYICGDARGMAKDVESTLLTIIQQEERLSLAEAQIYLKDLRRESRYQMDVYG